MIYSIEIEGAMRKVGLERRDDQSYRVTVDGDVWEVEASMSRPGILSLLIDGQSYRCVLDEDPIAPAIIVGHVRFPYRVDDLRSLKSRRSKMEPSVGPASIKAPMSGRVVRILTADGVEIAAQQGLIVVEAMKMQNELKSPRAGRIRMLVEAGTAVVSGQVLAIIE